MRAACLALGIASEHCIVLDQQWVIVNEAGLNFVARTQLTSSFRLTRTLPDSMQTWWPEDVIESWTRIYLDKWDIDTVGAFAERRG